MGSVGRIIWKVTWLFYSLKWKSLYKHKESFMSMADSYESVKKKIKRNFALLICLFNDIECGCCCLICIFATPTFAKSRHENQSQMNTK